MLTPKQELYCQKRNEGMTQRQAYLCAYPASRKWKPESVDVRASVLESDCKVSQRIGQLREASARKSIRTKAEYLSALDDMFWMNLDQARARNDGGETIEAQTRAMAQLNGILAPEAELVEESASKPFCADFALLIQPDFLAPHRLVASDRVSEIWLDGGRGSAKSSYVSLEFMAMLESDRTIHGAALMKQQVNLRQGVLAQIEWACDVLGIADHWEATTVPMELTNTNTGQKVFFRGCDDPRKLKSSVKPPFGHIGVVWFEEADLFRGLAEIRSVNQSFARGGDCTRFYTYNPPRSRFSWVNKHVEDLAASGGNVFHSCYTNVPPEWLGQTFIDDAEQLRETDELAYRHEYLGEPVGNGTEVFDRVEFRAITDDEIRAFDNPKCGQDFGWYPDPWAWTLSEWRQSGRTLYTYAEGGGCKMNPAEQARSLMADLARLGVPGVSVLSDDADPQAIASQRDEGVNARPAKKGGMRDASYRFLQSCRWVIDPVRCPNLAREVRAMQYEVNRDGEVMNSIPDGNDHWVDATRYAMMRNVRHAKDAYRGD